MNDNSPLIKVGGNNNSLLLNHKSTIPNAVAQDSWWRVGMKDKKVMSGLVAAAIFFCL